MSAHFYDSDRALAEYLLFHYGTREEILPYSFGPDQALDFPVRCVTECIDLARLPASASALDLGCAVGRSSFELARHCTRVLGIDYSHRFIAAANHLQEHGAFDFSYAEEGALTRPAVARVPADIPRPRVRFEQGDAQDLAQDLGPFDVVLVANLIDRLREPKRCLASLPRLTRSAGQLILTSPYTWLDDFTPRQHWLGGVEIDGRRLRTLETLRTMLQPDFELAGTRNLPFLIREHARKFQWSVAEASLWIRT